MTTDALRYAGFWPRLGALLLDMLITLPVTAVTLWGSSRFLFFPLWALAPLACFLLFYNVELVRSFGGTPGKLIMGVRIPRVDGTPIGYREAILRYLPEFVFWLLIELSTIQALFRLSEAEYTSLSFFTLQLRLNALTQAWYKLVSTLNRVWTWGEFIVLLTNRKRRALHDFLAGTVVVYKTSALPVEGTSAGRVD